MIGPESIDGSTAMVLVNAIYFKGKWKKEFNKGFTNKDKFFVTKDKSVDVDMMFQTGKFLWKELQDFDAKIIELPYDHEETKMIIILPNKKDGLDSLETQLELVTLDKFHEILNITKSYPTDLKIPKFKLETTIKFIPILEKMGFKEIFLNGNFGAMIKESNIKVDDVVQKAFIEVI